MEPYLIELPTGESQSVSHLQLKGIPMLTVDCKGDSINPIGDTSCFQLCEISICEVDLWVWNDEL